MTSEPLFDRTTVDGTLIERVPRPAIAAAYDLQPHPEGGWYRRTWATEVPVSVSDAAGERIRPTATSVLFALPAGEASAWHTVTSDELWLWHGPGPVTLELGGRGAAPATTDAITLGLDAASGQLPQTLVPAGIWQRTVPADRDAVVSCVVSPGFDFADFALEA